MATKKHDRIEGQFLAVPYTVLRSAAYIGLSCSARSLLFEIALQSGPDNNGALLASWNHLSKRNLFKSKSTLAKCLKELLETGLIHRTAYGQLPNKAAYYALGWKSITADRRRLDPDLVASFERDKFVQLPKPNPPRKFVETLAPLPRVTAKKNTFGPDYVQLACQ